MNIKKDRIMNINCFFKIVIIKINIINFFKK